MSRRHRWRRRFALLAAAAVLGGLAGWGIDAGRIGWPQGIILAGLAGGVLGAIDPFRCWR